MNRMSGMRPFSNLSYSHWLFGHPPGLWLGYNESCANTTGTGTNVSLAQGVQVSFIFYVFPGSQRRPFLT